MQLKSFIVCDDIRHEVSNKQTLVGVYLDSILFRNGVDKSDSWPKAMKLCFYILFSVEDSDTWLKAGSKFRIYLQQDSSKTVLGHGLISINSQGDLPKVLRFSLPHDKVPLQKGDAAFIMDFLNDKDEIIQGNIILGKLFIGVDRK